MEPPMRIKERLKALIQGVLASVYERYPTPLLKAQTDDKVAQLILQHQFRAEFRATQTARDFRDVGFRQYSQCEEDGILLYLFSLIPPQTRRCLEVCAGDGMECNTANLILNHGWSGWLFDGDAQKVQRGQEYYRAHPDTAVHPPTFSQGWITAENINQLVADAGLRGPIDLLSLDLDGNDYWIWKALEVVDPVVVVCEVHNPVPPDVAVTMPYDPAFTVDSFANDFRGVSLAGMVSLGREKGYRLVGTHRHGFNAFFIKRGIAEEIFPERPASACTTDDYSQLAQRTRWPKVKDKPWVHV